MISYFRETFNLNLDIELRPSNDQTLQGYTSSIQTLHFDSSDASEPRHKNGRVHVLIRIQEKANKQLARFAIAHELYHLIQQASQCYIDGKILWRTVPESKMEEHECNAFGRDLCEKHNQFYHSEEAINNCKWPQDTFSSITDLHNLHNQDNWPPCFSVDGSKPAWYL